MDHDTPEAIAITDKAARELLEVEALNQCSAAWGSTFAYQQGKIRRLQESNAELLEALQMFMKAGVGNSSDHGVQCCAANLAKQAIAKSLGEQA